MYYLSREILISGSHQLKLNYKSPCEKLHGHNWKIIIYLKGDKLDKNGMLLDFKKIKDTIMGKLDHVHINDVVSFNPTAENLCKYILDVLNHKVINGNQNCTCYKVDIEESEGSVASYEI